MFVMFRGFRAIAGHKKFIIDAVQALKLISDIIERGVKDHPELMPDGELTKSVGNTLALQETALIEAFNLKVSSLWSANQQISI